MLARRRVFASASAPPEEMDGEVTSAAEIITVAENPANAGKSYWMRGGSYGAITLDSDARPSSVITFLTYPGEVVTFTTFSFAGAANLTFDGNEANMTRAAAGGFPDGDYGLRLIGTGVTGYDIPAVPNIMNFSDNSPTNWNEDLTFSHFRIGDDTDVDESNWRCQHAVEFSPGTRDVLFEDFDISYIGADLRDYEEGGAGDENGGGTCLRWFQTANTDYGNFTFRRGHFHHSFNDFVYYGPSGAPPARVLFDTCMFEELTNFGAAHADMCQIFGGSQRLEYTDCVFRTGTDFLWHGDVTGEPRVFTNCLFGDPNGTFPNLNNPTLSKDTEGGIDAQWIFDDCSMEYIESLRLDSTAGSSFAPSPKSKIRNCIYPGFSTVTSVNRNNVFENDSQVNKITGGGTGVTGDTAASPAPTYDADGECTNYSQGWRMPVDYPWSL